jgi:hypothetical protein
MLTNLRFAGFSSTLRAIMLAGHALLLAAALAGCSSETEQRKAFMTFLQTRIVDKPGLRIPRLTPDETKSLGQYAPHFAVIRDFHDALDKSVSGPMKELMGKRMISSLPDLIARRNDLAAARDFANKLGGAIDEQVARANTQRAALKQPDDLNAVYDLAFAKTVTNPSRLIKDVIPALDATFASAEKLAQYIDKHSDSIKVRGATIEVNDPKIQTEVNALITELGAKGKAILDAQRKLQDMAS